jgi:hypothetical protein
MTYQPMRFARWLFLVVFAAFGAAAVGLVVAVVRGDGPPLWFAVLWLAGVAWNAYWWLGRTCVQVQVDSPTLTWRTPLTGGTAALHDVLRIRSSRMSRQLAVIELRTHRPLLVPVRYGFGGLERAIAAGSPGLDLDAA